MRILVIDEEFPWPCNSGKRIRSYNLSCQLARTHTVHYLAYGLPDDEAIAHFRDKSIECVPVRPKDRRQSGIQFYLRLLKNLLSPLPYIVTSHYSCRFLRAMQQHIRMHGCDMIVCEWTPYALFVWNEKSGVKKIVVAHNIESRIWQRYAANEKNALRRWYIGVQEKKVARFERECLCRVDGATAVCQEEAQILESWGPGYRVGVIDNGVDCDYFHPQPRHAGDKQSIVFCGSMDWRPNQDAVRYLCVEIFPRLSALCPGVQLIVVGRNPPADIRALQKQEIIVTGTVDDVRPYVSNAAVFVVPLRIGGGSRLKILEAMAMGIPVVSTTIGAEGLALTHGENIRIADTPDEFIRETMWCLEQTKDAAALARQGRLLVEQRYQWSAIARRLNEYLAQTLVGTGVSSRQCP